jgi:hypothetical protein
MAEEEVWYSCKVAEERGEVSSLGNHRGFSDAVVTVRGGQVYLGAQPRIKVIAQAAGLFKGVNGNRNIIRRNGDRTDDRLSQVVLFNEPSQQCANYIARAGPNEEWKPVRVFTDKRIVQSIDGRILSNMNGASLMPGDTVKDVYISNYGRVATLGWSIERLSVDGGGYVKYCGHLVHRLVALLFVPNDDPVGKPHVDHAHGNPADNRASELQWMSQKENNAKRQFVMPTYCLTWCEGDDFYAYCDDGLFQSIPLDTEKVTRALTQRRKDIYGSWRDVGEEGVPVHVQEQTKGRAEDEAFLADDDQKYVFAKRIDNDTLHLGDGVFTRTGTCEPEELQLPRTVKARRPATAIMRGQDVLVFKGHEFERKRKREDKGK